MLTNGKSEGIKRLLQQNTKNIQISSELASMSSCIAENAEAGTDLSRFMQLFYLEHLRSPFLLNPNSFFYGIYKTYWDKIKGNDILWLFEVAIQQQKWFQIWKEFSLGPHLDTTLPPGMILADHNIVLWQVKYSSPPDKIYHADWFESTKSVFL